MINGKTSLIAHLGHPIESVKAPMIYNPWFDKQGINAEVGVAELALFDTHAASCDALAARLRTHYRALHVATGSNDPGGFDLIVNATPLGMNPGDALPFDVSRIAPSTFVGEVVMKQAF